MYKFLTKKSIAKSWMKQFGIGYIDICIATFNRLPYLQKCLWSIIASTTLPYRIYVVDDMSTDGSKNFLERMVKDKLIYKYIPAKAKLGTANALNTIINSSNSKLFVFANDDMWFHRWWELISLEIFSNFDDCGMVSMFNYSAMKVGTNSKIINPHVLQVKTTGLGATMMDRELWLKSGGFRLNAGQLMGYFATGFCGVISKLPVKNNKMYAPTPPFVTHMDLVACKLNERNYSSDVGYTKFRETHKK